MKPSTLTSSQHLDLTSQETQEMPSLEQEYNQWKNDAQAQREYQQWLKKEQQRRNQLPDPLKNLSSKFNEIFGEMK